MLGVYIKYMRKSKNIKQKYLAEKLFIAPATLSHYERGSRMVPFNTFVKICEICEYNFHIVDTKTGKDITEFEISRLTE